MVVKHTREVLLAATRQRSAPLARRGLPNLEIERNMTTKFSRAICSVLPLIVVTAMGASVEACPFCSATSQTLSEELAAAEVAIIARLSQAASSADTKASDSYQGADSNTGLAKFEVVEVLRGADKFPDLKEIQVVYFGQDEADKLFLINGIDAGLPPTAGNQVADWTTPLPLSERGVRYVKMLGSLSEKGPDRMAFFMQYFEDDDPLLAQDAYDEFARAPYSEVIDLSDRMDREQLMQWIDDPEVGPTRRRLYLTMLGICGQPQDVVKLEAMLKVDFQRIKPALEALVSVMGLNGSALGAPVASELVRADVRRRQQCLDALIAAYLKLKGPAGLPLIEERFLANPDAQYTHVYATIMALRFHGEETDILPRERLLEAMRLVLDNPEISDQVIPDLARWEDWSILDRLVTMFNESEQDGWIRQPVIAYLLTAAEQPGDIGQRAGAALAQIEELDPQGIKRARSYMSFGMFTGRASNAAATGSTAAASGQEATDEATERSAEAEDAEQTASVPLEVAPLETEAKTAPLASTSNVPSRFTLISAPLVACLVLMGVFALLLRGADVRSSGDGS